MRQRPRRLKTGDARNRRMRSDIEENPVAREHAHPTIVKIYFKRFRRNEASASHNQLGAGRLIVPPMQLDLALHHVALALANRRHIGPDRPGHRAELSGVMHQMRHPRAPDLVLAGHAGDVGTGAANPAALDNGGSLPRLRHMPGQQLAALTAAEDQDVELFRLRHDAPPLSLISAQAAPVRSPGGRERRTSLRSVGDAGTAYLFPGHEYKRHMLVAGYDGWHWRGSQPGLHDAEVGHTNSVSAQT